MRVRAATAADATAWDAYVDDHPDGLAYHASAWTLAAERAYRQPARSLVVESDGRVRGVLPLVRMTGPGLGRRLVSLPYCDAGSVLADDLPAAEALVRAAVEAAERETGGRLELRAVSDRPDLGDLGLAREGARAGADDPAPSKVRMIRALPESPETLSSELGAKLRSQIRKAEKNGLTFRWGSVADLDRFYDVFAVNMRDLGSPVHGRGWFRAVLEAYGERAWLGLVDLDGAVVAVGIVLRASRIASIPWASSLRSHNRLAPNMLLYWKALERACSEAIPAFDFGRSTPGEGTYRFKAQWGALPRPLVWWHRPTAPEPGGGANRERIARLWARLPLPVANLLGPPLRRRISL